MKKSIRGSIREQDLFKRFQSFQSFKTFVDNPFRSMQQNSEQLGGRERS
jgi:hypothetical protein